MSEYLRDLEDDIIDFFKERLSNFSMPIDLKFCFQSNSKLKQLIKIVKIPDQYEHLLQKELLVQINSEYFDNFDDKSKEILFDQEIDKINIDLDKGTIKIGKANFVSNKGIIEKYSYDEVQRAIEVEQLYEKQKSDSDKDSQQKSTKKSNKKKK